MIKGPMLRDAMISASKALSNVKQDVDALNVFPVPDGDTGTNMSMTFSAAADKDRVTVSLWAYSVPGIRSTLIDFGDGFVAKDNVAGYRYSKNGTYTITCTVTDVLGNTVSEKQTEAIYKKIAGRSFDERVTEYSISGSVEEIARVAETDMTRVYNQAVIDAAKEAEKESGQRLNKVWSTMLDEKVRTTHAYLEGMSVPLDAEFYTYDGDHAQAPCGFTSAENNVNCRCQLDIVPAPIEI